MMSLDCEKQYSALASYLTSKTLRLPKINHPSLHKSRKIPREELEEDCAELKQFNFGPEQSQSQMKSAPFYSKLRGNKSTGGDKIARANDQSERQKSGEKKQRKKLRKSMVRRSYFSKFSKEKDPGLLRIAVYLDFLSNINFSNRVRHPPQPASLPLYKAFVGRGNNNTLIKNCFKSRFWWTLTENEGEANFYWSQRREVRFLESLPESVDTDCSSTEPKASRQNRRAKLDQEDVCLRRILSASDVRGLRRGSKNLPQEHRTLPKPSTQFRIHNHLEQNWNLSNKKALFANLKQYYQSKGQNPWENIPLTFNIAEADDPDWERFASHFNSVEEKRGKQKNVWIVKPGEYSNRGCGIQVSDSLEEIRRIVAEMKGKNGKRKTTIVQEYLKPYLYNKRKFDFRCYVLVTSVLGCVKAYWYEEGYLRTASREFTLKNLANRMIHLTNDAVQKKSEEYGKFQSGNKISYSEFQKYLDSAEPGYSFSAQALPRMQRLARDAVEATFLRLDPRRRQFTCEVFGLDFMMDAGRNVFLIEVNNNPCLELSSPLLARLIPSMVENAFRIAVDPLFPPPPKELWPILKRPACPERVYDSNRFSLIFSEEAAGPQLSRPVKLEQLQDQQQKEYLQ